MENLERRLTILVLRTLGCSQDEVADLARCAKKTVADAERWFTGLPQAEAVALVEDHRIKRLAGREFPDTGLTKSLLIKADQVTGDDVLLHYGRAGSGRVPEVAPAYTGLLVRHWDRLRQQAIVLQEQLSPTDAATIFSADACQRAYEDIHSGSPFLIGDSWSRYFNAPVELRLSGTAQKVVIEARLPVETDLLFPHLVSHLQAEFGELDQVTAHKKQMGRLLATCLERAARISQACRTSSGVGYLGRGRDRGLSWHFPAFICQFVLGNLGSGIKPRLRIESQPGGLARLSSEESPATALAIDTPDHIARCQAVLVEEVEGNARLQAWRQIGTDLTQLAARASELQSMLATVIERGDFKDTCPLCQGYFTTPQSA